MPLTLDSFKAKFPIPAVCKDGGEAFEYFWHYDLPVRPEQFWPFISDSSRMNREVGYEEVFYHEEKGTLYGYSGEGRFRQEWIEFPFEWNYPVYIRRLRKYSKGLPSYNFIQGYIEPTDTGCTVYIHNVVYSHEKLARRLLPGYLEPFGERYGATFRRAAEAIENTESVDSVYPPIPVKIGEEGERILEERLLRLRESGFSASEIKELRQFIVSGDCSDLHRIRPLALHHPLQDAHRRVAMFMHGVLAGLFTMNYEVICPHCRGNRESRASLAQVPPRSECHICEIEFQTGGKESLEITFRLHPSIAETRPRLFCAAEPSHKTHVRLQRMLSAGPQQFPANLSAGRYRFLLQKEQLPLAADFKRQETDVPGMNGQCKVENPFNKEALLMVEEPSQAVAALRPSMLFRMQEFRDLFAGEQLAADLQIDLGRQTIAFVDIVGSTRFYEERGDGPAFGEVKRHFEHLFRIVQKHRGAVIKTIGDGAMFCFPSPLNALKAGLESTSLFAAGEEGLHLAIRYTMHEGPCLAVNFNTGIDFFGRTVNLAAKLQNITGANQVCLSQDVHGNPDIQDFLRQRGIKPASEVLRHSTLLRSEPVYIFQGLAGRQFTE
ncbi:MAG: adenylate/guanylate cyclase domain-containing protein [Leptospiraceae bacterium]|nr:adenylate/guanylate cyclase domain-containing protein [Leptospiraceae bacterium]